MGGYRSMARANVASGDDGAANHNDRIKAAQCGKNPAEAGIAYAL